MRPSVVTVGGRLELAPGFWSEPVGPLILPPDWSPAPTQVPGVACYLNLQHGIRAILGRERRGGRTYLHLSVTGRGPGDAVRLPTWGELVKAKEDLIGAEVDVIQLLPRRSIWRSITDALHVYCREEGGSIVLYDLIIDDGDPP